MKLTWVPTGICIPENDTSSFMVDCASPKVVMSTYGTASCSGKITQTDSISLKSCAKNDDDDVDVGYFGVDTCLPPAPLVLQLSVKQVLFRTVVYCIYTVPVRVLYCTVLLMRWLRVEMQLVTVS